MNGETEIGRTIVKKDYLREIWENSLKEWIKEIGRKIRDVKIWCRELMKVFDVGMGGE